MGKNTRSNTAAGGDVDDDLGSVEKPRLVRAWTLASLLFFGLAACWSVATPLLTAPDEPAQVVRAAAVAHGELLGQKVAHATTRVHVPAGIAHEVTEDPACYQVRPRPAGCPLEPTSGGAKGTVSITTYVGHYPPLYYAIVGLPSLLTDHTVALYLMRLVSAALSAMFLGASFCAALYRRGFVLAPFGVALAVTPMALYLAGMVNPSGLEISTTICMCSTGLALASDPGTDRSGFLLGWLALSSGVLVQTRGLSLIFAAVTALGIVLLFGWRVWASLLSKRAGRFGLGFVVVCSAFAIGWFVVVNPTEIRPAQGGNVTTGGLSLLSESLHHYVHMIPQMIGTFGSLDTPSPQVTYVVWYAVLSVAGVVAIWRWWRRAVVVILFLLVCSVVLPVAAIAAAAHSSGFVGQGRDWLPLAVSVPLVISYAARQLVPRTRHRALASSTATLVRLRYPAAASVAAATLALGGAELAGFLNALHRYRSGIGNGFSLFGQASWSPPVSPVVLVAGAALLLLTWSTWAGGAAARAVLRAPLL